ncbi:MAG: hypothetical protein ACREU4_11345, partial [Burkholderiales bacterium]
MQLPANGGAARAAGDEGRITRGKPGGLIQAAVDERRIEPGIDRAHSSEEDLAAHGPGLPAGDVDLDQPPVLDPGERGTE